MPIYKVHSLHSGEAMGNCIRYISNILKTTRAEQYNVSKEAAENDPAWVACRLLTGMNVTGISTAAREMVETRERSQRVRTHYGYHLIQSFAPDAPVTGALAHQIGCQMAARIFPGHQAVVATHLNRPHLHNHIAASSVSLVNDQVVQYPDGVRRSVIALARHYGAILLPYYGMQEIQFGDRKEMQIPWQHRHWQGMREDVNLDIREAAARASSRDEMLAALRAVGYETGLAQGRDAIRPPGGRHFWHIAKFYRPWELRAMVNDGCMRREWDAAQLAIASQCLPHSADDTWDGRLTDFQAQILYWVRILLQHDRAAHPEMPHQVQRELTRTMKAYTETRRMGISTESGADESMDRLLAKCAALTGAMHQIKEDSKSGTGDAEAALEDLRVQHSKAKCTIRLLRDAKRAAKRGRDAGPGRTVAERTTTRPETVLLPES